MERTTSFTSVEYVCGLLKAEDFNGELLLLLQRQRVVALDLDVLRGLAAHVFQPQPQCAAVAVAGRAVDAQVVNGVEDAVDAVGGGVRRDALVEQRLESANAVGRGIALGYLDLVFEGGRGRVHSVLRQPLLNADLLAGVLIVVLALGPLPELLLVLLRIAPPRLSCHYDLRLRMLADMSTTAFKAP